MGMGHSHGSALIIEGELDVAAVESVLGANLALLAPFKPTFVVERCRGLTLVVSGGDEGYYAPSRYFESAAWRGMLEKTAQEMARAVDRSVWAVSGYNGGEVVAHAFDPRGNLQWEKSSPTPAKALLTRLMKELGLREAPFSLSSEPFLSRPSAWKRLGTVDLVPRGQWTEVPRSAAMKETGVALGKGHRAWQRLQPADGESAMVETTKVAIALGLPWEKAWYGGGLTEALSERLGLDDWLRWEPSQAIVRWTENWPAELPVGPSRTFARVKGLRCERTAGTVTLRWASLVKADDGSAWVLVSIARGPYDGELERFETVAAKVAEERRAEREAKLESASVLEALRTKKPAALRAALRAATTRAAIAAKHLASVVDEPGLFALLLEAVPPHERQAHLDKLLDDDLSRARPRAVDPRTAVRLGANLDAVDPQHRGRTLLSRLSSHAWELRRVRALLAAGADPDLQDEDGMTALHHAQDPKVMKALVEAGAALDMEDQSGATALVELLRVLALNAAPGRQQPRAPTAEELALARLMIERGAQPSGEALRQLLAPWSKNRKLAAAASALMGVVAQRGKPKSQRKPAPAR